MLSVEGLDVFHGDAQALDQVTLAVPAGAIVAIVGAPASEMRTMRATDGVPCAFIANSIQSPGSAKPGFDGTSTA